MIKKSIKLLLCIVFVNFTYAQDFIQDFEGLSSDNWNIIKGSSLISNNNGSTFFPVNQTIKSGNKSWQLQGSSILDKIDTLELSSISINGNHKLKINLSCVNQIGKGLIYNSDNDFLYIQISKNGNPFTTVKEYTPVSNVKTSKWGFNGKKGFINDELGIYSPDITNWVLDDSTQTISEFIFNIDTSYHSIAPRIVAKSGKLQSNRWNVDKISIPMGLLGCNDQKSETFYEFWCILL